MAGNLNSGRKPKSEELAILESLSPLMPSAYSAIKKGVEKGDFRWTKLLLEYTVGKPKIFQDITLQNEQPLFDLKPILLKEIL